MPSTIPLRDAIMRRSRRWVSPTLYIAGSADLRDVGVQVGESERARAVTWIWGPLAAAALLWPDRLSGPFDGVPLDRAAEAVLIGVIFPTLWVFHPQFLATRFARASIVALMVWKTCAAGLFVPDGWCVRFGPSRPYAKDAK